MFEGNLKLKDLVWSFDFCLSQWHLTLQIHFQRESVKRMMVETSGVAVKQLS